MGKEELEAESLGGEKLERLPGQSDLAGLGSGLGFHGEMVVNNGSLSCVNKNETKTTRSKALQIT